MKTLCNSLSCWTFTRSSCAWPSDLTSDLKVRVWPFFCILKHPNTHMHTRTHTHLTKFLAHPHTQPPTHLWMTAMLPYQRAFWRMRLLPKKRSFEKIWKMSLSLRMCLYLNRGASAQHYPKSSEQIAMKFYGGSRVVNRTSDKILVAIWVFLDE